MNKSSTGTSSSAQQGTDKGALVDQAKHAVGHVAEQAREQVEHTLDARKDSAVQAIGTVAEAVRGTSQKLKGVGPLGDVAGRAADRIEDLGSFFEGKNAGDIVQEVNRFARREPAIFLGAAFALGLIGGRFLKSSTQSSSRGRSFSEGDDGGGFGSYGAGGYGASQHAYGAMEGSRATYARERAPITQRTASMGGARGSSVGTTMPGMGATQAGTPAARTTETRSTQPATQVGGGAAPDAKITTGATKPGPA